MNVSVYIGAEHFSYDFFKEMLYKMLTPYTTSWFVNRTISRAAWSSQEAPVSRVMKLQLSEPIFIPQLQ